MFSGSCVLYFGAFGLSGCLRFECLPGWVLICILIGDLRFSCFWLWGFVGLRRFFTWGFMGVVGLITVCLVLDWTLSALWVS